jgi:hypothetical protein
MANAMDVIQPSMQRGDTDLLLGGASEFSESLKKERAWLNRLLLRHILTHEYPVSCPSACDTPAH